MFRRVVGVVALVVAVAGCGTQRAAAPAAAPSGSSTAREPTVYSVSGEVFDDDNGLQLCLGLVMESYPPQCGQGLQLEGWSWTDVDGYEHVRGTRWGSYEVTGTFDGTTFTLTEPAGPPDEATAARRHSDIDVTTPCEPPDGGWSVVDASKATNDALFEVSDVAAQAPDFAGSWLDQSINPAYPGSRNGDGGLNDPTKLVFNVRYTGDLERHVAELRDVWGGALCVTSAERSLRELRSIEDDVNADPNVLSAGTDVTTGTVYVDVIVDDGAQERLDERYGRGVTHVSAALHPVDP